MGGGDGRGGRQDGGATSDGGERERGRVTIGRGEGSVEGAVGEVGFVEAEEVAEFVEVGESDFFPEGR